MKLNSAIKTLSLGSIVTATALTGFITSAHAQELENVTVHTEFASYDLDGFSDDGTMLVVGAGYQFSKRLALKVDYGMSINDAENTFRDGFGNSVTVETDVTQIRAYAEADYQFGDSDFGAHIRSGIVNLDGDVSASSNTSAASSSADVDETNLLLGGGLNWKPGEQHRVSVNFDVPASDVSTLSAGYQYNF